MIQPVPAAVSTGTAAAGTTEANRSLKAI